MDKSDVEQHISEYAAGAIRQRYIEMIHHLTGFNADDAEAVYQDALLGAWKMRERITGDDFKPYFDRIVRRGCINARNARRDSREVPIWGDCELQYTPTDPAVFAMADRVIETLDRNKDRAVLLDWMQDKSPDKRAAYIVRQKLKQEFR